MSDERRKLRDEAEAAANVVIDAWAPHGPIPRTAMIQWIRATNERLRRVETGQFADTEKPTDPQLRTMSQKFRLEKVKQAILEGRIAAGLEVDLTAEELTAVVEEMAKEK